MNSHESNKKVISFTRMGKFQVMIWGGSQEGT